MLSAICSQPLSAHPPSADTQREGGRKDRRGRPDHTAAWRLPRRHYFEETSRLRTRIAPTNPNPFSMFCTGGTENLDLPVPEVR